MPFNRARVVNLAAVHFGSVENGYGAPLQSSTLDFSLEGESACELALENLTSYVDRDIIVPLTALKTTVRAFKLGFGFT